MNIITCQHEWVLHCQTRYRCEPPVGLHFENAHYPLSEKQGGTETVRLWYPDHIVQGVLQTLNTQYPCIHTKKIYLELQILEKYYPEYLDLYWEAYSFCQRYAGQQAYKLGTGIHKQTREEKVEFGKKSFELKTGAHAPENKGKGAQKILELGIGIHLPEVHQRGRDTCKKLEIGIYALTQEERKDFGSKGGKRTAEQVWKSLIDGHTGTASAVARHNRKMGWDPAARVRIK
jgi:hypothetical protein